MTTLSIDDRWESWNPYEQYIGRWSRRVAPMFLSWLDGGAEKRWVDVGCGPGALATAILDNCSPRSVVGVEPSEGFLKLAVQQLGDRARLLKGDAGSIPLDDGSADIVVSGLVLNFVPDLQLALREMARVTSTRGTVAAYVWDYAQKMELLKFFWDAAVLLDPVASDLHEGVRFPLCNPQALREAFESAGFTGIEVTPLDVTAIFASFDEFWKPFLGGQGPAPAYVLSLSEDQRSSLKETLRAQIKTNEQGAMSLNARAWAIRGTMNNKWT
jgi:ubiquinone/menaquinone biosynthesis C-methylase UbiE